MLSKVDSTSLKDNGEGKSICSDIYLNSLLFKKLTTIILSRDLRRFHSILHVSFGIDLGVRGYDQKQPRDENLILTSSILQCEN